MHVQQQEYSACHHKWTFKTLNKRCIQTHNHTAEAASLREKISQLRCGVPPARRTYLAHDLVRRQGERTHAAHCRGDTVQARQPTAQLAKEDCPFPLLEPHSHALPFVCSFVRSFIMINTAKGEGKNSQVGGRAQKTETRVGGRAKGQQKT